MFRFRLADITGPDMTQVVVVSDRIDWLSHRSSIMLPLRDIIIVFRYLIAIASLRPFVPRETDACYFCSSHYVIFVQVFTLILVVTCKGVCPS